MKALLTIIAFAMPLIMWSQKTDSLALVAKSTAESVIREQKSIDSIQNLKEQENLKQIQLIKKIRDRILFLKSEKKLAIQEQYQLVNASQNNTATKPDSDIVYWEEVRRKWTGRLFNKDSIRIRVFRWQDGKKIYLY